VRYQDLVPYDTERPEKWSRICPACKKGVLLVHRNQQTLVISRADACIRCGRRFIYTDIESMWEKDGMTREQVVAEVLRRE